MKWDPGVMEHDSKAVNVYVQIQQQETKHVSSFLVKQTITFIVKKSKDLAQCNISKSYTQRVMFRLACYKISFTIYQNFNSIIQIFWPFKLNHYVNGTFVFISAQNQLLRVSYYDTVGKKCQYNSTIIISSINSYTFIRIPYFFYISN